MSKVGVERSSCVHGAPFYFLPGNLLDTYGMLESDLSTLDVGRGKDDSVHWFILNDGLTRYLRDEKL